MGPQFRPWDELWHPKVNCSALSLSHNKRSKSIFLAVPKIHVDMILCSVSQNQLVQLKSILTVYWTHFFILPFQSINLSKPSIQGRLHDQLLKSLELGIGGVWGETENDALGGGQERTNLEVEVPWK